MQSIPRFCHFDGYETIDVKEYLKAGRIEIHLERQPDKPFNCFRCGGVLEENRGRYRQRLFGMPIFGYRSVIVFWRKTGYCPSCKHSRSENVSFIAKETPHFTQDYAWWLGRMCEIAPVSRVAEFTGLNGKRLWTIDFRRMQRMAAHYKIPKVRRISVDEVYARKKRRDQDDIRDDRFFTVISDLETHRVIWVSESRRKEALDQFYLLIGKNACAEIEVVACDQHDAYAASTKEHCPNATIVWDRFHIMRLFEEAVNDTRKELHLEMAPKSEERRLSRGQYRFLFLKKASRRTDVEKEHIEDVLEANQDFAKLEIIKERMLTFFDQRSETEAKAVYEEIGEWIYQAGFRPLIQWYRNLERGWTTLKNYFRYRVTSALSEGINNVIKALKRRAYGYKNMLYFRLKIMQVCGYLNSRYVPTSNQLLTK
jgi:transposase